MADLPDVPEKFRCCITQDLMEDPVMATDGKSYERSAIERWLQTNDATPTRVPCTVDRLVPNLQLREDIAEWQQAGGGTTTTTRTAAPTHSARARFVGANSAPTGRAAALAAATALELTAEWQPTATGEGAVVTVAPPAASDALACNTARPPVHVALVLDTSTSMDRAATLRNEANELEQYSNNLLDIVKLGAKAVGRFLAPGDFVSVVTFDSEARVQLRPTRMSDDGRRRFEACLDTLEPNGCTNLGDGVRAGMEELRSGPKNMTCALFLLTDGEPNEGQPALEVLAAYHARYPATRGYLMNTFAFGFDSIDSVLMSQLADQSGGGYYTYIPDSGFVATTFVHAAAATLTTLATDVHVVDAEGNSIKALHAIRAGQAASVLLPASAATPSAIHYRLPHAPEKVRTVAIVAPTSSAAPSLVSLTSLRQAATTHMRAWAVSQPGEEDKASAGKLQAQMQAALAEPETASRALEALLEDWTGQIQFAQQPEFFAKWGRHYLLAMAHGHDSFVCTNHKDASLAVYGGARSAALVAEANVTFNLMPPPRASRRHQGHALRATSHLNNRNAGCVHPDSAVTLGDGSCLSARNVRPGMLLRSAGAPGGVAAVTHVMASRVGNAPLPLVVFPSGLRITPWHPVWVPSDKADMWAPALAASVRTATGGGQWVMPALAGLPFTTVGTEAEAVYTFALEGGAAQFEADGVPAIGLAHGIKDDAVASHPFFGTSAVLHALTATATVVDGVHFLPQAAGVVDPDTGLISNFAAYNA